MSNVTIFFIGVWLIVALWSIIYWGNLAWFHTDKLKEKVVHHFTWPFTKEASFTFVVWMLRFNTLIFALSILVFGVIFVLAYLDILK